MTSTWLPVTQAERTGREQVPKTGRKRVLFRQVVQNYDAFSGVDLELVAVIQAWAELPESVTVRRVCGQHQPTSRRNRLLLPPTSVNRRSRPSKRYVSVSWSSPKSDNIVACRSFAWTRSSTA